VGRLYAVPGLSASRAGRRLRELFEAHSFTGRGDAVLGRRQAIGADRSGRYGTRLSPLTRNRFADPAHWVTEELHI
jgi:hypothetical protein